MMDGKQMKHAAVSGMIFAWMLVLLALTAAICAIAGDGELLTREMLRHAPPASTGLPEAEYPGMGRMIADYLTGREKDFQYSFTDAAGHTCLCFQQHEADHMADCRALIRLAGTLRWIAGGIALVSAGIFALRRPARTAFAQGALRGLAAAVVIGLLILAWALIDFDGLFTAFHRLAFTNDGWLLDTRTDLLIRLMPITFFISLGTRVLAAMMTTALLAGAAAGIVRRRGFRKEQEP